MPLDDFGQTGVVDLVPHLLEGWGRIALGAPGIEGPYEPETTRFLRSPRRAYGKGVAYGEIDGRGLIYITSPAFFLWALDAKTGRPLES